MKIATLIAGLGLGALVLSGCGGSGSSNPSNPSELSEDQQKLIGEWLSADPGGCRSHEDPYGQDPESVSLTLTVTESDMALTRKKYNDVGCKDSNLTLYTIATYNYKLGEDTVFSDDTSAKKLDLTIKDFKKIKGTAARPKNLYTMYKFITHDEDAGCPKGKSCLLIAERNSQNGHDGSTPDKRADKKDDGFIKQ